MLEMVTKQAPSLKAPISRYGEAFAALAFAAGGNPRTLLKTLSQVTPFNSTNATRVVREYYREAIWAEHSKLGDRYRGHRALIDWGRDFVEKTAIPTLHRRNADTNDMSLAIWIHRDAPAAVEEALRLLCYSGILLEGGRGLRATRSGTGNRYIVNPGCLAAVDSDPIAYCTRLRHSVSIRRMTEFGANNAAYKGVLHFDSSQIDSAQRQGLEEQLARSIDILDLSAFQKTKLRELGLCTVREVLASTESDLQRTKWVGVKRSRQMRNAATAAVFEYLSG
jgi:hypothetical protein